MKESQRVMEKKKRISEEEQWKEEEWSQAEPTGRAIWSPETASGPCLHNYKEWRRGRRKYDQNMKTRRMF